MILVGCSDTISSMYSCIAKKQIQHHRYAKANQYAIVSS